MKILIDMNLSPDWTAVFERQGWEAVHWSKIGSPKAKDRELLEWAAEHGFIVSTHDLDFGAILAAARARAPSVLQVRTQDVSPDHLKVTVCDVLRSQESAMKAGALIVVDEWRARIRVLPITP